MKIRVTVTEAARRFAKILRRVAEKGETFIVERRGRAVCEISPVRGEKSFTATDFAKLIESAPRPDDQYFDDAEEVIRDRQPARKGISTKELLEVLRSGPNTDKGYLKTLERITRGQPTVAPSLWDRRPRKSRRSPR